MNTILCVYLLVGITACAGILQERVVGGDLAKQSKFPFVASLRTNANKFLCAGAIVNRSWVLTAAECVQRQTVNNLTVVVGSTDLQVGGVLHRVSLIKMHPNYINRTKENNIALIKIVNQFAENKNVEKIRIAKDPISDGKDVEVAGWGSIGFPNQNYTNNLRWIEMKTISFSDCKKYLPNIYYYNICTKGKTTRGPCHGDVGSPLIRRGGFFSNTELHGIVSQYAHCANGLPDVYVSTTAFKLWIDQIISN
ncbi:hypothetical protein FQR65_LT06909 [Abscondita terminalis]|nr:hypothetical protein FQR65_LT06909 [Abscondita terminalis]